MHGKERVAYFYTTHTRDAVEHGVWKDDIAQFAEYIQPGDVVSGKADADMKAKQVRKEQD